MTDHPSPEAEAAARAAQVVAASAALLDAYARNNRDHLVEAAEVKQRDDTTVRAARFLSHATASATWAPAYDERWLRSADVHALLEAWAPAAAWAHHDPVARDVAGAIEHRLRTLHPDAMRRFTSLLEAGHDASSAMSQSAALFPAARSPHAPRREAFAATPPTPSRAAPGRSARRR